MVVLAVEVTIAMELVLVPTVIVIVDVVVTKIEVLETVLTFEWFVHVTYTSPVHVI